MPPRMLLYRFGYTLPAEIAWCGSNPDADLGEASSMCFVVATAECQALETGNDVAEQFVHLLFGTNSYSWKQFGFASWLEDSPDVINWALSNNVPVFDVGVTADIREFASQLVNWANRGRTRRST